MASKILQILDNILYGGTTDTTFNGTGPQSGASQDPQFSDPDKQKVYDDAAKSLEYLVQRLKDMEEKVDQLTETYIRNGRAAPDAKKLTEAERVYGELVGQLQKTLREMGSTYNMTKNDIDEIELALKGEHKSNVQRLKDYSALNDTTLKLRNWVTEFGGVWLKAAPFLAGAINQIDELSDKLVQFNRSMSQSFMSENLGMDIYGNSKNGSLTSLAGNNNISTDQMLDAYKGFSKGGILGKQINGSVDAMQRFGIETAKLGKFWGVESTTLNDITGNLVYNFGTKVEDLNGILKDGKEAARANGIAVKGYFDKLREATDMVGKHYIGGGIKGLQDLALYAAKADRSISSIIGTADRFKNIQSQYEEANKHMALGLQTTAQNLNRVWALSQIDPRRADNLMVKSLATDVVRNGMVDAKTGDLNNLAYRSLQQAGADEEQIKQIQRMTTLLKKYGISIEEQTNLEKASLATKMKIAYFEKQNATVGERLHMIVSRVKQIIIDPIAALLAPIGDILLNGIITGLDILGFVLKPVIWGFETIGKGLNLVAKGFNWVTTGISTFFNELGVKFDKTSSLLGGLAKAIGLVIAALITWKGVMLVRNAGSSLFGILGSAFRNGGPGGIFGGPGGPGGGGAGGGIGGAFRGFSAGKGLVGKFAGAFTGYMGTNVANTAAKAATVAASAAGLKVVASAKNAFNPAPFASNAANATTTVKTATTAATTAAATGVGGILKNLLSQTKELISGKKNIIQNVKNTYKTGGSRAVYSSLSGMLFKGLESFKLFGGLFVGKLFSALNPTSWLTGIKGVFSWFSGGLRGIFAWSFGGLRNIFGWYVNGLKGVPGGIANAFSKNIDVTRGVLSGFVGAAKAALVARVAGVKGNLTSLKNFFTGAKENLDKVISKRFAMPKPWVSAPIHSAVPKVGAKIEAMDNVKPKQWDGFKDWFSRAKSETRDWFSKVTGSSKDWFTKIKSDSASWFSRAKSTVSQKTVSGAKALVSKFSIDPRGWFSKVSIDPRRWLSKVSIDPRGWLAKTSIDPRGWFSKVGGDLKNKSSFNIGEQKPGLIKRIGSGLMGGAADIKQKYVQFSGKVDSALMRSWSRVTELTSNANAKISNRVSDLVGKIRGISFKNILPTIRGTAPTVGGKLATGVGGFVRSTLGFFGRGLDSINKLGNNIIGNFAKIGSNVMSWFARAGGLSSSLSSLGAKFMSNVSGFGAKMVGLFANAGTYVSQLSNSARGLLSGAATNFTSRLDRFKISFSNSLGRFSSIFNGGLTKFGSGFMNAVRDNTAKLTGVFKNVGSRTVGDSIKNLTSTAKGIKTAPVTAGMKIVSSIKSVFAPAPLANNVSKSIVGAGAPPAKAASMKFISTAKNAFTSAPLVSNAVKSLAGSQDVLGKSKGLLSGLQNLIVKGGSSVMNLGKGLVKGFGLAGIATMAGGYIGNKIGGKGGSTVADIANYAGTGALLGSFVPIIGTAIGGAIGATVGLVKSSWSKISSIWSNGSTNIFQKIGGTVSALVETLLQAGKALLKWVWNGVKSLPGKAVAGVKTAGKWVWGGVKKVAGGVVSGVKSVGSWVAGGVKRVASGGIMDSIPGFGVASAALVGGISAVKASFGKISSIWLDGSKNIFEKTASTFKTIMNGLWDGLKNLGAGLWGGVTNLWDSVTNWWNDKSEDDDKAVDNRAALSRFTNTTEEIKAIMGKRVIEVNQTGSVTQEKMMQQFVPSNNINLHVTNSFAGDIKPRIQQR